MKSLDGYQLYGFFRAGSRRVVASRRWLDDINVFPVPDGDTGTNLSSTLEGAVAMAAPSGSAASTLAALADAALMSARGNSGVIFAQFVSGLSEKVATAELRSHEFVEAVRHAHARAASAIADPRDGTMLSVIGEWAAALARRLGEAAGPVDLIGSTRGDLRSSLSSTTERLAELRAAGVVDAGAAGFVEFVEGGHDYLERGDAADDEAAPSGAVADATAADHDAGHEEEHLAPGRPPVYRYCTEAVVSGASVGVEAIRAALSGFGDSLIVASGRLGARVHVHTDDPEGVMAALRRFGALSGQKVDDMRLQYADAYERRSSVAIVTDSSCDLPPELLEAHRVHVVPLVVTAGGSEYLDKLTLSAERLRDVAEGEGAFPKTSQAPAALFSRLYASLARRYDDVVAIHLSGAMSGTLETSRREAAAAARDGARVRVVDSRHLSGSLGLVVLRAAEAAEAGMSAEDIERSLPEWSAKARILVSVTSLRYMVKGGRVSPLKGAMAKALNLKPIVSVDGAGRSELYGKSFSERANLRKLVAMAAEIHAREPLRYYAVGHSLAPEKAAALAAELERALGFPPLFTAGISSVVSLNAGPGAVSVVTMSE